jgi:hypothetical protein
MAKAPVKKWPHYAEWARQDAMESAELIAERIMHIVEKENDPAKLRDLNVILSNAYVIIRKLESAKEGRE